MEFLLGDISRSERGKGKTFSERVAKKHLRLLYEAPWCYKISGIGFDHLLSLR